MSTTKQKAIKTIESLSEDQLQKLIVYADTLLSEKSKITEHPSDNKKKRKPGVFTGQVIMSEDFFNSNMESFSKALDKRNTGTSS